MADSTTWSVRKATANDTASIVRISAAAHAPHLTARPDFFKPTRQDELAAWYGALLRQPTTHAFIAEAEGSPVGYVISLLRQAEETPFSYARRWLELDAIGVVSAYRQQGIARALCELVLEQARAEGLRSVDLSSWSFDTTAHACFAKLGFAPRYVRFEHTIP